MFSLFICCFQKVHDFVWQNLLYIGIIFRLPSISSSPTNELERPPPYSSNVAKNHHTIEPLHPVTVLLDNRQVKQLQNGNFWTVTLSIKEHGNGKAQAQLTIQYDWHPILDTDAQSPHNDQFWRVKGNRISGSMESIYIGRFLAVRHCSAAKLYTIINQAC